MTQALRKSPAGYGGSRTQTWTQAKPRPARQAVELAVRAGAVGAKAGQQEDVEIGRVIDRTVLAKQRRQIGASHADRQGMRRSAVRTWQRRLGTVGKQQIDDLGGAF